MNFEIVSILIFLAIIGILIYRDRKKIQFNKGLFIRRSNTGRKFIYSFAKRHEKKLRLLGNIGIIVTIIASLYGMYLILESTYNILSKPAETVRPLRLVLPSVSNVKLPGFVLGVPFWYWIISVFIVMVIHEPMHAFMARIEKVRIKSFGVLLFIVLPGAFVDPDEKQLMKLSTVKKLRIFSAGSFGNLLAAGLMILLLLGYNFVIEKTMTPIGVGFESLIPDSGAQQVGLKGRIIQINSNQVKDLEDFTKAMSTVKPNDTVTVKTTVETYNIKTISDPENATRPLIGISGSYVAFAYSGVLASLGQVSDSMISVLAWVSGLFTWVLILNLGVGIFNLFPLKPLDGGLMTEAIATHFFKENNGKIITNTISFFMLILILFNLFGPSLMKLA